MQITATWLSTLIEDSATVKTFYREEGIIRLQPENDYMEPIIVHDVMILGKVIGVFRSLDKTSDRTRV